MSRLLFAAARGARIESSYHNWKGGGSEWREANLNMLAGARIHPDDVHMQYGPISTALRNRAKTNALEDADVPYLTGYFKFTDDEWGDWVDDRWQHHATFLLILAEALADEGL
jgi:hypothetical protein